MISAVDALHGRVWASLSQTTLGSLWMERPDLRGASLGVAHVLVGFLLAVFGPLWLLLLAPLVLGVPHVASDLRFLVLDPLSSVPKRLIAAVSVPLSLLFVLRAGLLLGQLPRFPGIELALGLSAVLAAIVLSSGRWPLRLGLALAVSAVGGLMFLSPRSAALAVGHIHNWVSVALWMWWAQKVGFGPLRWWVLGAVLTGFGLIMSGVFDSFWLQRVAGTDALGLTLPAMIQALAPDATGPWGLRWVMSFAFLQAVHYSMWVWCIPQACAHGTQPMAPSERWAGWRESFGSWGWGLVLAASIALPVLGWLNPVEARGGYLSIVLFHGWLEFAIAAQMVASSGLLAEPK